MSFLLADVAGLVLELVHLAAIFSLVIRVRVILALDELDLLLPGQG